MAHIVEYTIKKNSKGIPTGRYKKKFLTKLAAGRFITDMLYSNKRIWYKYVINIKSNIKFKK